MLRTVTQYGVFTFLGAAVILLLSFVVEKGIKQVDDMLVPCQHGTSYVQGKCRCDGTPFDGNYCSNCKCEYGSCSTEPTTPFSNSDYGCRCPTPSKRFGFLCDLCNTVDEECKGDCKPEFFGASCERICYADLAYDNNNSVCNTMRSSGGSCSTCHGHGTCNDGFCDCDANWFDDGRKQCVKTCPGTPICSGHGTCKLYGDTPGCLCENGWNGPSCDIPCPGMETTGVPCNSRGICNVDFDANTALCDCNEKFRGPDCSIECPGDVVACNGHGTCDDLGDCTCQTNVKWSLPSCKCSDELTCSAKGTCNTQEKCECFGNNGGQHCMECKNNWHGDNCDLYCDPYLKANTSDKIDGLFGCYGHGTCLARSGAMECTCNLDVTKRINVKGAVNDYTSFYDPSMNCGECLDSYFPKQRVVDDHGMPAEYTVPCEGECLPSTCNNRGICNHNYGVPGELLCKCDIDHLDDASFCTECEANWYPLDFGRTKFCNRYCVASGTLPAECDGTIDCVSCNGHGTCTDEGDCLCTGGYTGDECQILCTSSNGKICGGHGTCESNEIQQLMEHEFEAEGNIPLFSCTCDPQDPVDADSRIDWDEKLALGLVNGTLDDPPRPEYFGQTCDFHCIRPPWEDADECNGLGNCTVVPIKLPDGASVPCKTDTECLSQSILQVVSGDSEWSNKKGPFCHKHDEIYGCDKTTDDCYEILLKQRPKKMRSEDCASNSTCLNAIDNTNWGSYCSHVEQKRQPSAFSGCKSVAGYCPAKEIPVFCSGMVDYTDGNDVSYKLNLAYEYDKRNYPFLITDEYRTNESIIEHDEALASFLNFIKKKQYRTKLPTGVCNNYLNRYPIITTVRENKQYICNGQLINDTNCNGTLENSDGFFYKPFKVICRNSQEEYRTYEEAVLNRPTGCTVQEDPIGTVVVEEDGHNHIDALCQSLHDKFPKCVYPEPCDFNPCLEGYSCSNSGTKAICETTGNLNSTCLKGTSERISYNSYSCNITIPEASCPDKITHDTNVAKHCKDNNPVLGIVPIMGENETQSINVGKYFHFEFLATDAISSSTILELGEAIRIYIRQGQIQINEVQALQSCPVSNQQCNDVWSYQPNTWYHIELELNNTHVTMVRKDTMQSITKVLLSSLPITNITTVPGPSRTVYRKLLSENDIPSPYSCTYETCDLDVSYREICSDIIVNLAYPSLLEPRQNVLDVCSNIYDATYWWPGPPNTPHNFSVASEMYGQDWDIYCTFYESMKSSTIVATFDDLQGYVQCQEFVDPLDGDKNCIKNALRYNWTQSCMELDEAVIPNHLLTNCPNTCYNHLLALDLDYCTEREELFSSNKVVIDNPSCGIDWYDYCLKDSKGTLDGTCSAVECSCDAEKYEGISGQSCELHCPIAADGSPCAENQEMGKCTYTPSQKSQLDNAPTDNEGNKLAFDPVWAIEGECQCFLSEGTRNCDIKCNGCNNNTYGGHKVLEIGAASSDHYTYEGQNDPDITACSYSPITIKRTTAGHTLRVVHESDCPSCSTGSFVSLPTSSLEDWEDINGNSENTYLFKHTGVYYYVCTAHPNMVGKIHIVNCADVGQIGVCDNGRGTCDCLPPFTLITEVKTEDWRGKEFIKIERGYNMPTTTTENEFRIRLMQGRESFIKHMLRKQILSLKTSGTNDNSVSEQDCLNYINVNTSLTWGGYSSLGSGCFIDGTGVKYNSVTTPTCSVSLPCVQYEIVSAYDGIETWQSLLTKFEQNPGQYICIDKPCGVYEVELLNTLQQTSSRYNFDCNKQCPGTDNTTQIPCSGRGSCSVVGQCVCDPAKIVVGVNEDGVTQQFQVIPGVVIEEKGFTIDKLGRTGYRGEDCAIMCKGFDPEEGDMTKVCNGRGKCDLSGECACEIGYIGDQCQFKCPFTSKVDNLCSGHGVCELAEIQIFDQVFDGSAKQCARSASYDVCQGYSIINDIGFLDISKITLKKEQILCASPSLEACRVWKDYQNLDYQNTDPFEIYNITRPSGCILEGNKISYNNKDNDVTCEDGCLCESVDRVSGVCSLESTRVIYHKLGGAEFLKEDGKYNTDFVQGGFEEVTSGAPDLSVSEPECRAYAEAAGLSSSYSVYAYSSDPRGCFHVKNDLNRVEYNSHTSNTVACGNSRNARQYVCIQKKMVNPILFGPDTYANTMTYCRNNNNCAGFFGDPPDTEGTYFAVQKTGSSILSGRTESYRLVTLEASCSGGKTEIGNYYEVTSGTPDMSVSEAQCQAYGESIGKWQTAHDWGNGNPMGCFEIGGNVYFNKAASSTHLCQVSKVCIQKPAIAFSTSTSQAVMIESCARVCRSTTNCFFFSVESNKCYKQDGCGVRTTGTSTIYELQSPEAGRPYYHYQKALPVLCMTEAGLNFDSKTQAPIIRSLEIHKNMCAGDLIMDTLSNKCVNMTQKPIIDAEFFFDKGSEFQSSMDINCQITGASTVVCAQCACFSDFIYGKWAGFECETCAQGNGKSQCREICPGFDGENLGSMCDGYGKCMFGSEVDPLTGERTFQEAQCICGQEEQFAVREPTLEIVGQYRDTGGIDNDGAINAYFYYTPVPYPQTFTSKFTAQAKCNEFNDLDNVDRGGYCYGVYREYVNSQSLSTYLKLHMGNVGGTFYLYGKYWGKKAISGYSHFYQFKSLELYQGAIGTTQIKYCADIETIKSTGLDTCNHFSSETDSCDKCVDGWTGKNCRSVCQRCLLGGTCDESPSETEGSACVCPAGAGALWEYQCCPTGFRVDDMVQWQSKTQRQVDGIRLSLEYDSSTTNELDAAYYCKVCPGVTHLDWMKADALYKVCSGPSRGTCDTISGRLGLKCNCKMNEVTKNRWMGRACSCDESIITPYSLDASIAESTDYGCQIPTGGNGMCPTDDSLQLFFNPPIVYRQDSIYLDGYPYGEPFYGYIAGTVFAREMPMCTPSDPCHTGEGPCGDDTHCAGNLKCFIRNAAEEKLSFNAEKISPTLNYCYHVEETMVGCHPTDYEPKGDSREYFKQFYWDIATSSFKVPVLGEYIPYSKDGNLAFVVHQQTFPCPVGRYGITVPTKVTHEYVSNHWCSSGSSVKTYEGNGDNEGSTAERATRCFESCMNQNTPLEGSWTFTAKAFNMNSGGKCYCRDRESASCGKIVSGGYDVYDIKSEGEWNICDKCQPGKYQDTTGNIGWVKVTSGANTNTITQAECETYADWHGKTFYGPPYSNANFPHGCFIYSNGDVYFQQSARTTACSSSAKCLQYGGKGDRHPNCKNCPAGKFGGPIGSWSSGLCETCPPGTRQNNAGTGCDDCPAGKYESGGVCYQCQNGRYSTNRQVQCTRCPKGKDTDGQIGTAGTSSTVCRSCPAGKANNVEGADCLDCIAGYVQPGVGQSLCIICGKQEWQNLNGQTTCKTCGIDSPYAGNYAHVSARDTCEYCGNGHVVPSGGTNQGACTACLAGEHQPYTTLQRTCYLCATGKYNPDTGQADCKNCDKGYYQESQGKTSCKECAKGDYSNVVGLTNCKACAKGQYTNQLGQHGCKLCELGKAVNNEGADGCNDCELHSYADVTGKDICTDCAAGKYGTGSKPYTNENTCVACPSGKYNGAPGQACAQCPTGQYQNQAGQGGCKGCALGYYNTGSGNTGCTRGCSEVLPGSCLGNNCACYRNRGVSYGGCTGFYDDGLYEWDSYDCSINHVLGNCDACGEDWQWVTQVAELGPCTYCGYASCRVSACGSEPYSNGKCGHPACHDCSGVVCGAWELKCSDVYYCTWVWGACWSTWRATCRWVLNSNGCGRLSGQTLYCSRYKSCTNSACGCDVPCSAYKYLGCKACIEPKTCSRKRHWFWADC